MKITKVTENQFEPFILKYRNQFIEWRRDFHQYPELGWMEYRTTFRIAQVLEKLSYQITLGREALHSSSRMGLPSEQEQQSALARARKEGVPEEYLKLMRDGHTGLVAQLDTGKPGSHIALRFDIDALPIQETDDADHAPKRIGFHSKNEGIMHACGHDGHTAIGLAVAHFIHDFRQQLSGKFTLLFQPAEEGCRGAKAMVDKGWLDGVDFFLSGHIGCASFEIGETVASTTGFFATTKMNVEFKGKSAHAGVEPHAGKNALLAAAAAALQLHTIPRHAQGSTRLNVGRIAAGAGRNIIPDHGYIELETRGETNELNQYMVRETERIITAAALSYDVQASVEVVGEGIEIGCDPTFTELVQKICATSPRIKHIKHSARLGASEDVCYMLKRVQEQGGKATYMLFGSPIANGHHHPGFDYNEDVLEVAVDAVSRIVYHLSSQ